MWGEAGIGGPFEDLHVLVVVVLGMAVFLASVATAYLGYVRFNETVRLQRDAFSALDRIAAYPAALHDGTPGLLELDGLAAFNVTALRGLVGGYGFRLLLTDGRGTAVLDLSSEPAGEPSRVALTPVAVWSSAENVWPARLSLMIWRS